jgi:AcrR family transcriptional regulator
MGVAERRQREKDELRQRILDAATELFVQEGFDNVSIRKIADKIEYSPTTIYLHFKDKAELIDNICGHVFESLAQALEEIESLDLPPTEAMRRSIHRYIEFGLAHPNHYIVLFCLPKSDDFNQMLRDQKLREQDPGMACFGKLSAGVAKGMESGEFRLADLETTSQSMFMMMHGVTAALITMKPFPWVETSALIDNSVEAIIRAFSAR